jgi:sugar lactone lactonase YvrE
MVAAKGCPGPRRTDESIEVEMDLGGVSVAAVTRPMAELGEGPVWDARSDTLVFVDIAAGSIHRLDPARRTLSTVQVGQEVGAAIPRAAGGLVVAMRDGIGILDGQSGHVDVFAAIEADEPRNRMNDAACDPQGRLWAGTMAFDFAEGAASLYRVAADRSVTRVLSEVTISNGLGWSPAGDTMYYIDSATYGVDRFRFDVQTGDISDRERLITFPPEAGMPDGLTVDAEGGIWVALFGGGAVRRFHPDGTEWGTVELPVTQVTSACFGGPSLSDLYITSAATGLDPRARSEQPLAGATFVCRPGVVGLPAEPFAG